MVRHQGTTSSITSVGGTMAFSARQDAAPISGINVTPLVDVLLVLLIIFMISAPVVAHKARVDLPSPGSQPPTAMMEPIEITIEPNGVLESCIGDRRRTRDADGIARLAGR